MRTLLLLILCLNPILLLIPQTNEAGRAVLGFCLLAALYFGVAHIIESAAQSAQKSRS